MPLKDIKIAFQHGKQFVPDPQKAVTDKMMRGMPFISSEITSDEAEYVAALCPTGAIAKTPCSIDLGKCLFCSECHFALPDKIIFTNNYKMSTNVRNNLIIKTSEKDFIGVEPDKIRKEIKGFFKHALKLRQLSAGGDNSAEMELNAAGNVNFDMGRYGIEFVASPRHADGIVITGPISENMFKALKLTYNAIPYPKLIILAGTDAISGGLFIKSPAINRTFLEKYHIDLYIPGNPPHPLTFINGILDLIR